MVMTQKLNRQERRAFVSNAAEDSGFKRIAFKANLSLVSSQIQANLSRGWWFRPRRAVHRVGELGFLWQRLSSQVGMYFPRLNYTELIFLLLAALITILQAESSLERLAAVQI